MSVARVAGHPDYSSAGTSKFIPEIWSGKLLVKFYDATVLGAICNTDYEGEIKDFGDKIYIRTIGDVTINDYQKGQKLTYERIESPDVEMLIDKGKYWAFTIDDVDKKQSDIAWMNKWSTDASEQMKIKVDVDVLENVVADVDSYNKGATAGYKSSLYNLGASTAPVGISKANVLDYITDCGSVLDEQNIPETGRFMVIPSWFANRIKKSDLRDASLTNDGVSVLRNGRIGMIDRFTLYLSNNVHTDSDTVGGSTVTCYNCLFGTKHAISFATQLVKTESLRAESTFGDLVRGLQVYGYKVVKSAALGNLYARPI